eukprot:CAMPEP_0182467274 /NCGR_PEP_ID=MMETSP1319-20130603/13553_1 /TAXON_ID=172717 /ORGANISM="Bolidomonas pacifica, Strain RCC208" /LENGTH=34 /DNA_ID= /DNA_START= /DNA_END= /DNA_ORIENTATION=
MALYGVAERPPASHDLVPGHVEAAVAQGVAAAPG